MFSRSENESWDTRSLKSATFSDVAGFQADDQAGVEGAEELLKEEVGWHGKPLRCGNGGDHGRLQPIYLAELGATKLSRARIWLAGGETTTLS